jgi:hypothetical protein
MRTHQGSRDTVYFSVIEEEWPPVREALERELARPHAGRDG